MTVYLIWRNIEGREIIINTKGQWSYFKPEDKGECIFCFSFQQLKGERYRLTLIVSELNKATAVDYQTALIAFINCIVISTPKLQDRIRIRNEFIGKCCLDSERGRIVSLGLYCQKTGWESAFADWT